MATSTVDWTKDQSNPLRDAPAVFTGDKPRFDLIPPHSMTELAMVSAYHAEQTPQRNLNAGAQWGRIYDALQYHLNAFWGGETFDPVSGLPHLAHAAFETMALLEFSVTHPEFDDRANPVYIKVEDDTKDNHGSQA